MSEYSAVRTGKLKLKGAAGASHKKKKSKRKHGHQGDSVETEPGLIKHGKHRCTHVCLPSSLGYIGMK